MSKISQKEFYIFLTGKCQHCVSGFDALDYAEEHNIFPIENKYFLKAFRRLIHVRHKTLLIHLKNTDSSVENQFKYTVRLRALEKARLEENSRLW